MSRRLFRPTPSPEDPHRRDAPGMDEPLTSLEPLEREDAGEDTERPDRRGGRRRATCSAAALARLGGRGGALTAMGRAREARGRAPKAPGLACRFVAAIACEFFSAPAVVDQIGIPSVSCGPLRRGIPRQGCRRWGAVDERRVGPADGRSSIRIEAIRTVGRQGLRKRWTPA
jgi:hypothetical protein